MQTQHPARTAVAAASFMMGMLDVLDARTASGSVITRSSSAKMPVLMSSSSITASMTNCRSASSARSVVNLSLATAASRSRSVIFPALTPRSTDLTIRLRPAVVKASVGS